MYELSFETRRITKWFAASVIIWSGLIVSFVIWNFDHISQASITLATTEASAHFNKDRALRLWGTSHGGVYVPATEKTPPNPRLSHVPERDITSPSGNKLTLMNPAYMIRQMMNEYEALYGVKGRITTFPDKLFYQGNMPDDWELEALRAFQQGRKEVQEITSIDGVPHMRLMRPMYIENGCLKCHGNQGYKIGDIRGGVGIAVSMQPYIDEELKEMKMHGTSFFLIWAIGMIVLIYFYSKLKSNFKEIFDYQAKYNIEQQLHHSQKMNALETLIGGVAHDFNNRLASITGSLFVAQREDFSNPKITKALNVAEKDCFRMASTIKKLIALTESNHLSNEALNLNDCIRGTLDKYRSPDNVTFHIDLTEDQLNIVGDPNQLQRAFRSILDNACDAAAGLHPMVKIRTEIFKADDEFINTHPELEDRLFALLQVKDNGIGIRPEYIEHIFEPFFTTKDKIKGQGLGLSVTYGVIKSHHGLIEANSSVNSGCTMCIYLPLSQDIKE